MPFQLEDDGPLYVDAADLEGVPGLSRWTIRRLTLAERWPEPWPERRPRAWPLEGVAGVMRELALPLPRVWALPLEGDGGLDLRQWALRLPWGTPLRAAALLSRWTHDGGADVRPLEFGKGLAILCLRGGSLSRWRSDGGWLYVHGERPLLGRRGPKRRPGDWRGITTA